MHQLIFVVFVCWAIFFGWYCVRLLATCEGHVLRNAFDWPVCVR